MLKIAHVNFAKGFRGGERQTLLLVEDLSKKGYHQALITRKNSKLAKRASDIKNLTIIEIPKPYFLSLSRVKQYDIIHSHETKAAQFAYFANIFYKVPYIITRRVDNRIKNNFFNKLIYSNAKYIVALSSAIKKELIKIDKNMDIKIIPSAYSKLKIDNENVKKIKDRFEGKFLIGHIGELDNAHKGQYYLIEAMKLLNKSNLDIHLILLGKGKDEKIFKSQAKELKNITFEGFVDNVGDYIKCFDLFVFPSLHEGLGSILLDLMQFKVPIIASSVGGISDIIKDEINGILIPPKDSKEIYKAIKRVYLDKNLRTKLSNEAYKDIENFSIDNMSKRYIELYR